MNLIGEGPPPARPADMDTTRPVPPAAREQNAPAIPLMEEPVFVDLIRRARAQALENVFDAVLVTDMEGRVVDWNRGSELLYGYTREEMLGQPVSILHVPESREPLLKEVLKAVEESGSWRGEIGLLRKDGSRGWIESSVAPLFDDRGQQVGALGINRDISARIAAAEELRSAETRFRSLVEHSLVGIHIVQGDRLVYVNPRFSEIVGYTSEELLSDITIMDLIAEEDRELVQRNLRKRLVGEETKEKYSFRGVKKSGEIIHVEVRGTRIELDGEYAVIGMVQDVTEQHKAGVLLRASEERYRLIVQASTDVFRDWDLTTGTVSWGPSAALALHYSPSEVSESIEWWTSRIHPDDRARVVRGLYAVLDGVGDSWSGEYSFRRGDGDYAVILDRAHVVRSVAGAPTRVMSSMHDVTQRRRSEEAQAFLARASALLDNSLDPEATLTSLARLSVPFLADCCIVHILDAGPDERLRPVAAVHADAECETQLADMESLPVRGSAETSPIVAAVHSGEPLLVADLRHDTRFSARADRPLGPAGPEGELHSLIVVPLVARGQVLGTLTLGGTEARRPYTPVDLGIAENLGGRAAQALENARLYHEARAAVQARSRLFADISHEFRTPLMLTLGPLDDLLEGLHGAIEGAQRSQVTMARRNAGRVLDLINQILDLARLEAGRMPLHAQPLDLTRFVRETAADFAPLAARKTLHLDIEAPDGPVSMDGDQEQLRKVLSNLLSNALKFTPDGGTVRVRLHADDKHAWLSVRDNGPGIAPRDLERVFDRFSRAEGEQGLPGGTGIGLALAREVVELHGGTLAVESEEGFGSTFTATLPLGIAGGTGAASGADPASGAHAAASYGDIRDRAVAPPGIPPVVEAAVPDAEAPSEDAEDAEDVTTVLVVEDDQEIRAYLRTHLARDYRVLEATNGTQGLEMVRSALPDLVLSDVTMPDMDGFDLCRAIKQDPETDFIPVVLLTARAAPEDRVAGLRQEADDYLTKPFRADELLARTANLIASRRRLRERFSGDPLTLHARAVDVESADQRFLEQVGNAIEANMDDETYTVERLAHDVAHSRSQLYRKLQDLLDESPSDLIRRMRLERAAQLLEQGAGSVSSIAYSVGFKSVSHFSNSFQDAFLVRPSAYRSRVVT